MANKNVMELVKVEKHLTVDKAIQGTKNCQLVKAFGETTMVKAFSGVILMANDFFNTGQMNDVQAVQTASLLLEQYPYETIEDLMLCLKNAKIGKYGKVYNRIDGQVIFEWFKLYLDEKYERFEQIKREENLSHREKISETIMPFADQILEVSRKAIEKQVKSEHKNPVRINDVTHFEKFKEMVETTMTKEDLISFRKSYENENSKHHFAKFDKYIEVIDEKLNAINSITGRI
jgi:hypothetical protein